MRVVAIVAARNEERFITDCLEHLLRQGVQGYLIDNESTDRTVALAERFLGRGLVGIETMPYSGTYQWRAILERKEQIGAALDADWIMHVDADEMPLPPSWASTLAVAFAQVDAQGYNGVNFIEFTFVPTREAPDHDHPDFQRTMRWYYPFTSSAPFLMRAWKRQPWPVKLAWSGGHYVRFRGLRVSPETFPMRHYLFLSVPHAVEKYVKRPYDPVELKMGWHGWRARLTPEMIELPLQEELREYAPESELDASTPRTTHHLDDLVGASLGRGPTAKPVERNARMPACVAGMHRSGTSMVASLLSACRVHPGPEDDLAAAGAEDREGLRENAQFVALNEEILDELGGAWDVPPAADDGWPSRPELASVRREAKQLIDGVCSGQPWGWTNPRSSLTLPFWISLIPDLKVVLCVRDPLEVAWSLQSRNFLSLLFGLNLWLAYNRAAVAAVAPQNLLVTHYESYFYDPVSELGRLTDHLGVAVPHEAMALVCAAVSSGSRHHRASHQSRLDAQLPEPVLTLYRDLCARAGPVHEAARAAETARDAGRGVEIAGGSTAPPLRAHALHAQVGVLSARTLKQTRMIQGLADHLAEAAGQAETLPAAGVASRDEVETLYGQILALRDESRSARAQVAMLSARIRQHEGTSRDLTDWLEQERRRAETLLSEVERRDRVITAMHSTKLWRLGGWYWRARDGLTSIIAGAVRSRR